VLGWVQKNDGTYHQPSGGKVDSHELFEKEAADRLAFQREARERYSE